MFTGDTGGSQCWRAECNAGNSQVFREDPASRLFGCHHAKAGILDRSRYKRCKINLSTHPSLTFVSKFLSYTSEIHNCWCVYDTIMASG